MNQYNPQIHRRKSLRLKGYDYSRAGAYFVTLCAHNRMCLFGDINKGEITMNDYAKIIQGEWLNTAAIRPYIELGEYVIMPNHFHGIIIIHRGDTACTGTARRAPTVEQFGKPVAGSLPTIIRSFKSAVTKNINDIRHSPGMPIWQRNYYEHVIRDDDDYNRIAEYVAYNPKRWIEDTLHPDNQTAHRVPAARWQPVRHCDAPRRGTARRAPVYDTTEGENES